MEQLTVNMSSTSGFKFVCYNGIIEQYFIWKMLDIKNDFIKKDSRMTW